MDLLPSLIESYSYVDMYNNDGMSGGSSLKTSGGLPVEYYLDDHFDDKDQTGGSKLAAHSEDKTGGPLGDKVVPVGLTIIVKRPMRFVEYQDQDIGCQSEDREGVNQIDVLPDHIFNRLFSSVSAETKYHAKTSPRKRSKPGKKITARSKGTGAGTGNRKGEKST